METETASVRLKQWLNRATAGLWDLLFPARCVGCGRIGTALCPVCLAALPALELPICQRCGIAGAHRHSLVPCAARDWRGLTAMRSALPFQGVARKAIHQFKYNGTRALARPFGELLYASWRTYALRADRLIPVPLHPSREQARGYNQSFLLAQVLSELTGVPVSAATLVRTRPTRPQMELPASERRQNVAGAFACPDPSVRGQRLLLIDDVMTTASTLDACAQALRAHGAASVWGLTLAQAVPGEASRKQ